MSNSLDIVTDRRVAAAVLVRDDVMGIAKQLGVALLAFGLAGCAVNGSKMDNGADFQSIVAKKAQSRWDALIKGDLAAAYEYLSPGSRSVQSLEAYKNTIRPGMWKKASVDSVVCEKDRCDVVIMIEYSYRDLKSIETRLNEIWLQEDGNWWFVSKK